MMPALPKSMIMDRESTKGGETTGSMETTWVRMAGHAQGERNPGCHACHCWLLKTRGTTSVRIQTTERESSTQHRGLDQVQGTHMDHEMGPGNLHAE